MARQLCKSLGKIQNQPQRKEGCWWDKLQKTNSWRGKPREPSGVLCCIWRAFKLWGATKNTSPGVYRQCQGSSPNSAAWVWTFPGLSFFLGKQAQKYCKSQDSPISISQHPSRAVLRAPKLQLLAISLEIFSNCPRWFWSPNWKTLQEDTIWVYPALSLSSTIPRRISEQSL